MKIIKLPNIERVGKKVTFWSPFCEPKALPDLPLVNYIFFLMFVSPAKQKWFPSSSGAIFGRAKQIELWKDCKRVLYCRLTKHDDKICRAYGKFCEANLKKKPCQDICLERFVFMNFESTLI